MTEEQARLWALGPGKPGVVTGFDDTMSEAYKVRLMEFGFHPGEEVQCLLQPGFGAPRVYRVSNTVYSLDVDIAQRVFVRVITDKAPASS